MQKYHCQSLIYRLQSNVRAMIADAVMLKNEDPGCLLEQPAPGRWSVAQVLEHLNSYNRYYLPAIEKAIREDKPATAFYTPGWLGNYFTRLMEAGKDGEIKNKMRSPKDHSPNPQPDWKPVLQTFVETQQHLLLLLEAATEKNIGKIRVPISISRFIKLKLGDTFRFLIAHQQRHFIQLKNTLTAVKKQELCIKHPHWAQSA